jgi:hypothetical protein
LYWPRIILKIRQNKSLAQSRKAAKGARKYYGKRQDEKTIEQERIPRRAGQRRKRVSGNGSVSSVGSCLKGLFFVGRKQKEGTSFSKK